ncbi:hypothetical protein BG004_008405 [Podila humilis]|nr:hypothetical protein BG004_008405 [Podila humilis]
MAAYKAQKAAAMEMNIVNRMAEAATLQRTNAARQSMLSRNTIDQYLRYERHWVAWCARRHYPDTCVIPLRASRYMEENIAENPDPENGIEPLRVRCTNQGRKKNGPIKMVPPSALTVDMYINCLVNLHNQQRADPAYPTMTLQSYPNPRKYLAVIKQIYENTLARVKAAEDIVTVSLVQGHTSASLRQLLRAAWVRSFVAVGKMGQRKRNSLRDRLDICWLHFMMCRSESTRKARLPDLFSHEVTDHNGSGQFTLGVSSCFKARRTKVAGRTMELS